MVEVAHHAPRDRLEFREHASEQSAVVHLGQPVVETLARLEELQQRGAVRGFREEVVGAETIDVLLNARQRFFGHRRIGVDRGLEHADPGRGISRRLNRIEETDTVT